jgi:tRNA(fMet)-specific endonuclease VapC
VKYLIDTDWVIHYLNGNKNIREKISQCKSEAMGISVIVLAEVYEGIYYSTNPTQNEKNFRNFLSDFSILDINEAISKIFGLERGKLRKRNQELGELDLLIASTCLHHGLTLLSNNRKHFEMIDGLQILSLP